MRREPLMSETVPRSFPRGYDSAGAQTLSRKGISQRLRSCQKQALEHELIEYAQPQYPQHVLSLCVCVYEYDSPDEAAGKICGCTEERQCRTAWLAESLDMRVRLILKLLQWDADYVECNALLYWGWDSFF